MTPLLHFSAGSICLIPRSTLKNRKKEIHLNKCNSKRRPVLLLQPTFPLSWISSRSISKTRILTSAVEADVAVEADPNPNPETSEEAEPISEETEQDASTLPDVKVGIRKNVKKEDLVPGTKFTGIVRSMQPFGVFVDIGSFTDGLVHISQISSDYIKDVKALFTVGQEVEVRLLEYNEQTGRISLTMREPGDEKEGSSKESGKGGAGTGMGRGGWSRRRPRYVEGESYLGTIKEITEEGTLVTLPGDGEGFLPVSEQVAAEGSEAGTTLEAGEDIMVRVLSVEQDDITLTMKEEEYVDRELLDILDKKKEEAKFSKAVGKGFEVIEEGMEYDEEEVEEVGDETEEVVEQAPIEDSTVNVDSGTMFVNPFVFTFLRSRYAANAGKRLEFIGAEKKTGSVVAASPASIVGVADSEVAVSDDGSEVGSASITEEPLAVAESEGSEVAAVGAVSETGFASVAEEPVAASDLGESEVATVEAVSETTSVSVSEEPAVASAGEQVEAAAVETVPEVGESGSVTDSNLIEGSASVVEEAVAISEVEGSEVAAEAVSDSTVSENSITDSQAVLSESTSEIAGSEKTEEETNQKTEASDATPEASPDQPREVKATISPSLVKQLREETGAGMMDCKKALAETNGDVAKAQEYLRKKGLASADKKASRATAEGRIGSYVHDGRIGVLVEVNCETDFVSRGDIFKELVEDLSMQVAACPQVTYLTSDEVPEEMVQKEKEIEMQREDILSKPENIREKIVDGRIRKRLEEFALLEQPFIKNDKVVVKDYVKQTIATIGENIKVKRFVRFNLGEGLEKKGQDFAAEVAAQTAAKPAVTAADTTLPDEKTERKETAEEAPSAAVTISPALVKELREETGAGMMDCKKALAETGGDIEKAQEYLRKKGLSSADKKSSRIAAEGLISAYIHDSRIGCLIEVNSETDFVARNEKFKELVDDLAMQVIACPQVEYVSIDEVPASVVEQEKAIEMQREDLQSKPEQIRERIVEGRISKRLSELALLEQPFIKDDSVTVKELVKRTIASLGENIKVRRFVRFTLGESTD